MIKNVRQFELHGLNNGQIIDCTTEDYFLHAPKGLGIKFKNEYFKLGNIRLQIKSEQEYDDIIASLIIAGYERYEEFRKFISINRGSGFKLYYTPKPNLRKYILCDIVELQKTELDIFGKLNEQIIISPKSAWLNDVRFEFKFVKSEQQGKGYPYTYPYSYGVAGTGEAYLLNNGDYEVPVEIMLDGPVLNPFLQLFDVNNNLIQKCLYKVEVLSDEKFIINSSAENLGAYLINNQNEKIDKQNTVDFERDLFITLPVGAYTLKITDQNENEISGTILAKEEYLGA